LPPANPRSPVISDLTNRPPTGHKTHNPTNYLNLNLLSLSKAGTIIVSLPSPILQSSGYAPVWSYSTVFLPEAVRTLSSSDPTGAATGLVISWNFNWSFFLNAQITPLNVG
jgi:hypothetical protein